ncbi:5'-nucleotidase domain-containing protein [Ooceraea biroi]|uniref:5'-nucleotidase domain-containing protein n=1 Tax=Ooceraea biroi TaxID=2015173 RepID=A0A026W909_OOCBI|nr:5'-nucleotidase domain-containing protein [Ooceraea biroi]
MPQESKCEKFFLYNTLSILLKAVEKQRTTVDLRNEASIFGIVDHADAHMNVVMRDCVFTDPRGDSFRYDMFFVQARNIRCVHIPPNVTGSVCIGSRSKALGRSSASNMNDTFRFTDYDCIGFDLDNTLLRYNVTSLVRMEYEELAGFLVNQRGYSGAHLLKPLTEDDLDFMQKGLMLDLERGNVLRVSPDGVIRRASHGSRLLSVDRIKEIYPEQRWDVTDAYCSDMLSAWNGPPSKKIRSLLDYFDMSASIAQCLKRGEIYSQGNWNDLVKFLTSITGKADQRCLYVGDNLIQDIYVPNAYIRCDTLAVIEEQMSEGMLHHGLTHPDEKILNSKLWGSFFCLKDSTVNVDSLWGHVIKKHAKLCIPEIDVVVQRPLEEPIPSFDKDGKLYRGYYPAVPLSISAM